MNKRTRVPLEAYYRDAESWASDRQQEIHKSRKIAWQVAGVAAAIALLEAIALIMLTPLKTVVPYTLLVDRNTGFVQAVDPLKEQKLAADTALTQSFLVQYVIARESFEIESLQSNYRKVALWSAERARSEYLARMQPGHPQSPLSRYPRSAVVETVVKSVSPVGKNVAMVRFETRIRNSVADVGTPIGAWVAVIRYRYSGEPATLEDRFVNPLGFQVVRYRRDAEALTPETLPQAAPAVRSLAPLSRPAPSPYSQPPAASQPPPASTVQQPPAEEIEL